MLSHILTLEYIRTHAGWSSLTWILNVTYQIGHIDTCITLQDVFNIIIIINIIVNYYDLFIFFFIFLYNADTYIYVFV